MKRRQLFEVMDQAWCPGWVREGELDALRTLARVFPVHRRVAPLIAGVMRAHGQRSVVDLCSGGIGPLSWLWAAIEHCLGRTVTVVCTDRYPQPRALDALDRGARARVSYHPDPVDAARVPAALVGVRTVFEGFHHLDRPVAQALVADAVSAGAPLVIVEVTERSAWGLALASMAGVGALATAPLSGPPRQAARRTVRDLAFPVVPLVMSFDGAMSALRTWSPGEVEALAAPVLPASWRVRSTTWRPWGVPLSAVVIEPRPREPFAAD